MTIPTISALPTPPSRSSAPATFSADTDTFLSALPGFVTQANATAGAMNATAAAIDADAVAAAASAAAAAGSQTAAQAAAASALGVSGYIAQSTSSFSLTTGVKAFTVAAGKSFQAGDQVVAIRMGDNTARLYGSVSSYAGTTLTINVTSVLNAGGPFTDWIILERVFETLPSGTVADLLALTSTIVAVTPKSLADAAAFGALTDVSTIAWEVATYGLDATVTLTASGHQVGSPTLNGGALYDGCALLLELVQDATGGRTVTWNSVWDFGLFGTPSLNTTANKRTWVSGVYRSATGKIHVTKAWASA